MCDRVEAVSMSVITVVVANSNRESAESCHTLKALMWRVISSQAGTEQMLIGCQL